jgi:protein TonB
MSVVRQALHRLRVVLGGAALTLTFFLVLPLMQTISKPPTADLIVQNVDTADVPPPPPPPEEKPEDDPEPDEKPPELAEEAPPLDLAQLELALNPGVGDGGLGGDFAVKLNTVAASNNEDVDALFSIGDLDQEPRVIYQPSPILNPKVREKAPGTVHIIFIVDKTGRVEKPIIQKSSDSVFEGPALTAVKQWKFEPGKRNGQPVRFRMRVPITFPKGR